MPYYTIRIKYRHVIEENVTGLGACEPLPENILHVPLGLPDDVSAKSLFRAIVAAIGNVPCVVTFGDLWRLKREEWFVKDVEKIAEIKPSS